MNNNSLVKGGVEWEKKFVLLHLQADIMSSY